MPNEDNEIILVSMIDPSRVTCSIYLSELTNMLETFVQLKPMLKTILRLLKN